MENLSLDEIDMAKVVASRTPVDVKLASDVKSIFEQMLGDGKSVINPDIKIWTASVAEDLGARVEQNPIVGTELNQWEKLSLQLADAPDEVLLLAAELVFLREQPIRNSRPETRKEHIQLVLNLLAMTVELPQFMQDCLSRPSGQGGFRSGQGYNGQMWKHLIWCTKFIEHIAAMSDGERQTLQNDPWALQNAMLSSGTDTPDIRNALQFLMRPDYFEFISSVNTKARIREALAPQIGDVSGPEPQDVDKDLLRIRALFAEEIQGPFSFWSPGVIERWQPEQPKSSKLSATPTEPAAAADVAEPRQRHYWVYAPGEKASKWEEFSDGGIMAIGWDELGDFAQYKSQKEIRIRLANGDSNSQPTNSSKAVWDFQNEMEVGDIVYAKNGQSTIVGRGTVTSAPRFADDRDSFQHVREVAWDYVDQWDSEFKLPLKTLTDVTQKLDLIERLEALVTGELETDVNALSKQIPTYGRADFLKEVFLEESKYDRLCALLKRKKNVILAGPPGVGKTFTAKRLAYSVMGEEDSDRVKMVQFHQSYSYEDFMMGYRPTESGGFTLAEGHFYRFCTMAKDDPERDYFFIIDEINRGNISKIFGELLMLIEGDKRGLQIMLQYKNEKFFVPNNLHIIGMMNTADRSLAVLDYALRRRFGFFNLAPGFDTDGFKRLQAEFGDQRLDSLVGVLGDLNRSIIEDPGLGAGFAVGHSYLTPPRNFAASSQDVGAWLTSVVEDELVPLIDEYWFDEPNTADRWAERLRSALV
ncbi:hypothetical protein CZ765_07080 [Corynebacterium casei]|uniref:AAA family ATPase n=1 Tax=Corynebacterium casei TaxID=160386 RepID=UPI0009D218DD|nr:AAA family ATPase [Corynebacterium casei]SLM90251.1 hypothetical protein CZ765_07080 [Corynebacterium casei]